jgi:transcriptional regulator with XRE-family HTH domain
VRALTVIEGGGALLMMLTESPRMKLVGEYLRGRREGLGFSLGDVARVLECHPSKLSRIETGERGIRPKELRELLGEYGTDDATVETLVSLSRSGRRDSGWWAGYEKVLPAPYLELAGAEASASGVAVYAPLQVPELLQVPAYTAAVTAADPLVPAERQAALATAVASRQHLVLTARALPVEVLIGEAALRSETDGPRVMRAQLTRLAETAERPGRVTIRLLPFAAGSSALGGVGEFTVLRFGPDSSLSLVHLAAPSGGVYPAGLKAAIGYRSAFDHLQAHALRPEQTARRLRELLRTL